MFLGEGVLPVLFSESPQSPPVALSERQIALANVSRIRDLGCERRAAIASFVRGAPKRPTIIPLEAWDSLGGKTAAGRRWLRQDARGKRLCSASSAGCKNSLRPTSCA